MRGHEGQRGQRGTCEMRAGIKQETQQSSAVGEMRQRDAGSRRRIHNAAGYGPCEEAGRGDASADGEPVELGEADHRGEAAEVHVAEKEGEEHLHDSGGTPAEAGARAQGEGLAALERGASECACDARQQLHKDVPRALPWQALCATARHDRQCHRRIEMRPRARAQCEGHACHSGGSGEGSSWRPPENVEAESKNQHVGADELRGELRGEGVAVDWPRCEVVGAYDKVQRRGQSCAQELQCTVDEKPDKLEVRGVDAEGDGRVETAARNVSRGRNTSHENASDGQAEELVLISMLL
mmetsp:Transcript_11689/g.33646  ORF Transcript_11689/g.33646 Transcript_11689/m.33646 type:complete len:297 (-) Transcript_11689:150-1040(-)